MKHNKMLLIFTVFIALSAVFYFYFVNASSRQQNGELTNISILLRSGERTRFESLRQGVEQAASDFNAEINFLSPGEENDGEEQLLLLQRELENHPGAMLISAADSQAIGAAVDEKAKIPIVAFESPMDAKKVSATITADNEEMGAQLASELLKSPQPLGKVVILENAMDCGSIAQRKKGALTRLTQAGISLEPLSLPREEAAAAVTLDTFFASNSTDAFIALDTSTLETAAAVLQSRGKTHIALYGIGASGKVASYLEKKIITSIVVQNEFAIGYLGLQAAVCAARGESLDSDTKIEYVVIDHENMYEDKNQRILFPFIR